MKKIIRKLMGFPNEIYNKGVFFFRRVSYGKNLRINGRIFCVSNSRDGILIGNNVTINSNRSSNPIGGDTKTVLFAKNQGKIRIGNNCGLSNVTIFSNESIVIEDDVFLGGGVKLYDSDFHWIDLEKRLGKEGGATKPILIKRGAFVGAHTIVLKGVTIGEGAVIGAGSVVTKPIPDGEIWAGNPVKFIRKVKQ